MPAESRILRPRRASPIATATRQVAHHWASGEPAAANPPPIRKHVDAPKKRTYGINGDEAAVVFRNASLPMFIDLHHLTRLTASHARVQRGHEASGLLPFAQRAGKATRNLSARERVGFLNVRALP